MHRLLIINWSLIRTLTLDNVTRKITNRWIHTHPTPTLHALYLTVTPPPHIPTKNTHDNVLDTWISPCHTGFALALLIRGRRKGGRDGENYTYSQTTIHTLTHSHTHTHTHTHTPIIKGISIVVSSRRGKLKHLNDTRRGRYRRRQRPSPNY
jgi:hypothetical protein